jgi:hypothetical protein
MPRGLGPHQLFVLEVLNQEPGQWTDVRWLAARRAGRTPSENEVVSIREAIHGLVRRGLVERRAGTTRGNPLMVRIRTASEGEQHPAPCGLCGRVSTDWEDAPSMEGGQTVDPWCQPCLMAWDRGRAVGARIARKQALSEADDDLPDALNDFKR